MPFVVNAGIVGLIAGALLACQARHDASSEEPEAAMAASDTVIHRVTRLVADRSPSAIQRVTGIALATRALRPLDSVLVIRVLDRRGAEVSGASVRWTLANAGDGAALRVINATTDSLGLSRAEFTPGRSADAQSAIAEVVNVGRIDFAVTIPASAIRVLPDRLTLWAGDDTVLMAELRDADGNVLRGGSPSWSATDTAVIRVQSAPGPSARVMGALAGNARVVAWTEAGKVRAMAQVTVAPVLEGRFVTLDGRSPPAMRLEIEVDKTRHPVPVLDAAFRSRVQLATDPVVDAYAWPLTDTASYHRVHIRIASARQLQRLMIALVPTTMRIASGTYAGQEVTIDANRAMQRSGRITSFWRLVPISGKGPRKLLGWRESDLPLRIAFNRDNSREAITAADSAAFWAVVEQMHRDLGRTLFAPADMSGDTTRANFIRVEVRSQSAEGHTFVSWSQLGDATQGGLRFRRAETLRDPHVVTHELTHLLGFGHATGWPTIAEPTGGTGRRLTPQDVAHIQMAMLLRNFQERTGALPGLPVGTR